MSMEYNTKDIKQEGLVAIFIVSMVIVILALITTGFARIMNREFRQAIDSELSTQAHYAAESGMNDARAFIANAVANGTVGAADTGGQCKPLATPSSQFVQNGSLSGNYNSDTSDNTIKYTCVIINTQLKELSYPIQAGHSKVFKVYSTPTINTMYFGWQNSDATSATVQPLGSGATHPLPREATVSSGRTGILRTTIYGVPSNLNNPQPSDTINDALAAASRTYFMYPNASAVADQMGTKSLNRFGKADGVFVNGQCNAANINSSPMPYEGDGRYCNTKITQTDTLDPAGISFFYIRLTALYHDLNVTFQGSDASSNPLLLNGAQALIDVTAEGNDVLKRLEGRAPLQADYPLPNYALESMDTICKRLRLPKTGAGSAPSAYGDAIIDDTDLANSPDLQRSCQPST